MIDLEFDDTLESCLVCGGNAIGDDLVDHRGITISGCRACGFQFMNPQYTDRYLDAYYSQYSDEEGAQDWHDALLYGHDHHFSLIEKHVGVGKVLDVGCGHGHLLEAAMARGWAAHGFDVDETSTRAASARLGISVDYGDIFTSNLDTDYDLVAMHQVLEHIKHPNRYLAKVRSLIRQDGYLFIAVPNIRSMSSRFKKFMERTGIRKKNLGKYYDTSHHVLYFEPATLTALLAKHGFRVVERANCLAVRPGQSAGKRFFMKKVTNRLFAKSTFLFIAQKI